MTIVIDSTPQCRNKNSSTHPTPSNSIASSPAAALVTATKTELPPQPQDNTATLHLALFFATVVGCLVWTIWLIVLTVNPKGTINRVMSTESYDDGSFWLMTEPELSLHVIAKLADLVVQIVLLQQVLERGYPMKLVVVFTVMVCLHSLACATMILRRPRTPRELREVILETLFDFLAATGFPVLVVSYCLSTFDFHRAEFAINLAVFPHALARTLSLALLFEVEVLPDFQNLASLRHLIFALLVSLKSMPDLTPITKLETFNALARGQMCCNGFLDNQCDLSNPYCQPLSMAQGIKPATCLPVDHTDLIATDATRKVFARFADSSVCKVYPDEPDTSDDPLTPDFVSKCNGTLYHQCEMPGNRTGMRYNARMMPISCNANILPIAMRRQQIRAGVGKPCDLAVEAWLGCTG